MRRVHFSIPVTADLRRMVAHYYGKSAVNGTDIRIFIFQAVYEELGKAERDYETHAPRLFPDKPL